MVGVVAADLVSGFFECILYGIFFVLSTTSIALLGRRHNDTHGEYPSSHLPFWLRLAVSLWSFRRSPLIIATTVLFVTVTVHCVLSAHRLMLAIVHHSELEQAATFISDLGEITQVIRLVLLFVDMFVGDLVITYRVWLVWEQRRGIIVLPLLTTVALVVSGVGLIRQFITSEPSGSVFDPAVRQWITAYCTMTFCHSRCAEDQLAVIAYRIWAFNRLSTRVGLSNGGPMAILVESAALYTAWGIFFVVVYATGSHLQIVGTSCAPVVLGVTFMLITVRVGLGWGQESRITSSSLVWAPPPQFQVRVEAIRASTPFRPGSSGGTTLPLEAEEMMAGPSYITRPRDEKSVTDSALSREV
ncbi:hypothetical protein C8Q76DRAFT_609617 [Earliella scabrosa]|nr:hypothetical protein C8Q76DRAFT_609617 [Earliella scabrosa]